MGRDESRRPKYCIRMYFFLSRLLYLSMHKADRRSRKQKWFNINSIQYGIEMCIVKLTILMIYRRVFVPRRWTAFDIVLRAFESILVLFFTATTIVKIFECTPRARIWNPSLTGSCVNTGVLLNGSGIFNFLTDVFILLIPIKSVWVLKMKKKQKVQVVLVFTFGLM